MTSRVRNQLSRDESPLESFQVSVYRILTMCRIGNFDLLRLEFLPLIYARVGTFWKVRQAHRAECRSRDRGGPTTFLHPFMYCKNKGAIMAS